MVSLFNCYKIILLFQIERKKSFYKIWIKRLFLFILYIMIRIILKPSKLISIIMKRGFHMNESIRKVQFQLEEQLPEVIEWRRYLHQHPELSFQEKRTSQFILNELKKLPLDIKENVGGYGIVATLRGKSVGPVVAFRADFDALPIQDLKDVAYKSKNDGISHACGHDGHSAALLGFAKVLSKFKEQLHGAIVFIFQPAEELPPGGAKFMIEEGALEGVDVIFGAHLDTSEPTRTISIGAGYQMAAVDRFKITLQGLGGHGARPHETKDAIVLGSKIISDLQQIVSRRIDPFSPAVVTVGIFQSGSAFNIIADSAVIEGTVRTMTNDVRTKIQEEIELIVSKAAEGAHATYDLEYINGYPALYNHPVESELVTQLASDLQVKALQPVMGAEDFSYYLLERPGTYFRVGAHNEQESTQFSHHHPKFDFDEKALLNMQQMFLKIAAHYVLKEEEVHA